MSPDDPQEESTILSYCLEFPDLIRECSTIAKLVNQALGVTQGGGHGRPNLVTHVRQELALKSTCGLEVLRLILEKPIGIDQAV